MSKLWTAVTNEVGGKGFAVPYRKLPLKGFLTGNDEMQ